MPLPSSSRRLLIVERKQNLVIVGNFSDYKIEAIGAARGYDSFNRDSPRYRGRLAKMMEIFSLIKGETIKILVGQEGAGGVVGGGNTSLIIAGGGGRNRSTEIKAWWV
ncbi:hypothetical protein P5673_004317 [Acropora cervicornis]|uniref:Uncharacterized protein n=1 Tax=Acropora cervicornis TaxID=6130 RepID=A0AAD9VDK3_ACRCE|nr:hypothetical protein P5673_004317 [Acropora cervicornis]